jgi:threonine dehydratase
MAYAFYKLKLVVEPSGNVALAAVLSGNFDCTVRRVELVCFGGNVDLSIFARCLTSESE